MGILITGGTGYIGSHTAVELLRQGEDIIILDNLSNSKREVVDKIKTLGEKDVPFYPVDLLDKQALEDLFEKESIDSVVHFAGLKAVGESVKIPLAYYENNLTGTINLCQVMDRHNCKNLVFSSSATVYGMSQNVPFKETHPTSATNPYGWTKLMIEQLLQDVYSSDNQWSIALLRYFNPIGAHPSGLLGEDPEGIPNNLVPYIARVALGKLPHLQIFGDDYDTEDGTGVRDYLHVVDLAQGHLNALAYVKDHTGVEAINLGTGSGYSVLDVLHAYEKACGKKLPYRVTDRRPGDIAVSFADPTKARNLLSWEAQRDLEEMCVDSWNFTKQSQR